MHPHRVRRVEQGNLIVTGRRNPAGGPRRQSHQLIRRMAPPPHQLHQASGTGAAKRDFLLRRDQSREESKDRNFCSLSIFVHDLKCSWRRLIATLF